MTICVPTVPSSLQEPHLNATIDTVNLGIAPNPSHLEAIDPVVLGFARAQQVR